MVVGTLSLVQKGQTSGCDGHSGIVVYGGGNNVFGAKLPLFHCVHCVHSSHLCVILTQPDIYVTGLLIFFTIY